MKRFKKKAISMPQEFSGWFIWALIILIVIISIIFILKGKLWNAIDYFKSFLRFGGSGG